MSTSPIEPRADVATPPEFPAVQRRHAKAKAARPYGVLAQTFMEAMRIWDQQKADGVSLEDRQRGLELTLRAAWPQVREWKYVCARCDDVGFVWDACSGEVLGGPATCGRNKLHGAHTFGRPCFCKDGARFRETSKADEDFTTAGKKKRTWARVGR